MIGFHDYARMTTEHFPELHQIEFVPLQTQRLQITGSCDELKRLGACKKKGC